MQGHQAGDQAGDHGMSELPMERFVVSQEPAWCQHTPRAAEGPRWYRSPIIVHRYWSDSTDDMMCGLVGCGRYFQSLFPLELDTYALDPLKSVTSHWNRGHAEGAPHHGRLLPRIYSEEPFLTPYKVKPPRRVQQPQLVLVAEEPEQSAEPEDTVVAIAGELTSSQLRALFALAFPNASLDVLFPAAAQQLAAFEELRLAHLVTLDELTKYKTAAASLLLLAEPAPNGDNT